MLSEFGFEPRTPTYGLFLVLGLFDTTTHIWPFLAIFGPFLGHLVELEGKKELMSCHGAIKAHVECSHRFYALGRFEWILGPFWATKGCFGAQNAQFWEAPPDLAPPPRVPPMSFWLKTWIW